MTRSPEIRLIIDVFHATTSGQKGEILQSFYDQGINPERFSNGHGQGRGFYVWTTMEKASEHARTIKLGELSKSGSSEGAPVVVVASVVFDPQKWELDVEAHRGIANEFLNSLVRMNGGELHLVEPMGSKIVLKSFEEMPRNFAAHFLREDGGKTVHGLAAGKDDPNLRTGEILGRVFAAIRTSEFSSQWQDFVAQKVSSMADIGLALKYIGDQRLPIRRILPIEEQS
ncbi:MAG: hypothetical protein QY326_05230 [Bdellovibrionota bacterium]|nr:MAG: hypothetical protein QY326_05230 [Bdellovibrionota bacterium]